MARRKRLEMPSAQDLARIEAELDAGQGARRPAPIAQVAAETASLVDPRPPADRLEAARDRADAERLRAAEAEGRLIRDLPLDEIDADDMVRDRLSLDPEELEELKMSILAHGLRLPIEIYELAAPRGDARFGVLSGYRRLQAMRSLRTMFDGTRFTTIKAVVNQPRTVPAAFVAMVEENEIRSGLSPFERGRIAVIATRAGAFVSVEAAVDALFASASRAKRAKVRRFAEIFEELGEALRYPWALTERQGLRLAAALVRGYEERLRDTLAELRPETPEAEWQVLEPLIAEAETGPAPETRGGRPRKAPRPPQGRPDELRLVGGVVLRWERDETGYLLRLEGPNVPREMLDVLVDAARHHLAPLPPLPPGFARET
jgi:ParB family chromosome partitioning protein